MQVEFAGQTEGSAVADVAVDGEVGRVFVDLADFVELEVRPEALAVLVEDLVGDIVGIAVTDGGIERVERVGVIAEEGAELVVVLVGVAQVFIVAAQGVLNDVVAEGAVGLRCSCSRRMVSRIRR